MIRQINKVLNRLGCEVRRLPVGELEGFGMPFIIGKYKEIVDAIHDCFSKTLFNGLPTCPGRKELLGKLVGTPVCEGMYIISAICGCIEVPGDVCEFGVAQGATSALIANEIRRSSKDLWLFDSFEGLPHPTEKDVLINDIFGLGSVEKYTGTMASPMEMVTERLNDIDFPFDRTHIVPGFIEKTIQSEPMPERVCFAYVDFDFYEPILTTLKFLRDSLNVGGVVIVDDYGFFSAGAKTAVDEFLAEAGGEFEMELPQPFAAKATPFCILKRKKLGVLKV